MKELYLLIARKTNELGFSPLIYSIYPQLYYDNPSLVFSCKFV